MESSGVLCESVRINFDRPILDALDLRIPYGSIYGLVGASGCGKTTLIRCIWGYYKPSHGIVRTLGHQPDAHSLKSLIPGPAVGYMPQDVNLDNCLTARETLAYFGKCYNILDEQLDEKLVKFRRVLKIKNLDLKVNSLSSGQRRRLSFVCSVINEPSLLLLDEPTVGSDPVTRDFMWKYIIEQRDQNGATVLVTTHYIDELIYSNMIGIMRDGKIQLEVNPTVARSQFTGESLSSIIGQIMYKDEWDAENTPRNTTPDPENAEPEASSYSRKNVSIGKMNRRKDTFFTPFMHRQSKMTQRLIILPALIACICNFISIITFSNIYGNFDEDSITFAIVDPANQSKVLLDIDPIHKIPTICLPAESNAMEAVESRANTGYILFADEFEARMLEWVECLFKNHPSCSGKHVGIARYHGDYSNFILSEYARWILDESFRNIALNLSKSIHGDSRLIDFIETRAIIEISGPDVFYSKAHHELVWRLLVHISFCNSLFVLGMILVSDKKNAVVERQLAIGYKKHQIIFYHLIWNILIALITSYINYFTTVPLVAPVNVKNSHIFPLFVITILTIVSVLATHILVEFIPNVAVLSIFNLFSIISGFSIGRILRPSNTFPYYATYLSNLFPSSAGGDAVVAVMIQGMDYSSDKVIWSLIELIAQTLVYFVVLMLKVFCLGAS